MQIRQFEDKGLSHYSYAILSEEASGIIVIDPSRDIRPYLDYAREQGAKIAGVIETHPHADFVSGHLELHETTGAILYCSALQRVDYPHEGLDEGAEIRLGEIALRPLNTPGHSPDSISIVLNHDGKDVAVFTGDTLFIGDCGRPDLRESTGNVTATRNELAASMYHSLRDKLMKLDDEVILYPAHGAGTLCGKALSKASQSTIGDEKRSNWALQDMTEASFVQQLTADQPFVPKYFGYDVSMNRKGAPELHGSLNSVPVADERTAVASGRDGAIITIDARKEEAYKSGHAAHSINIQDGGKFETWLGSIVAPGEPFYLAASEGQALQTLIRKAAKIGYEPFIREAFLVQAGDEKIRPFDLKCFREQPSAYTIVDVRNRPEVAEHPIFPSAINIPLHELREHVEEIPRDKPIVVHCAAGYRSAAGSSIIANAVSGDLPVYDMGEHIREFGKS